MSEEIARFVYSLPIIDTHEHIQDENARIQGPHDPISIFLSHYLSTDFLISGIDPKTLEKLRDPSIPLDEKWSDFVKFWELSRNTGYARVIRIILRDIYGEEEITFESIKRVAGKMKEMCRKGFYKYILKDRANIELCIVDVSKTDVDRELFAPVLRFDDFIYVHSRDDIKRLSKKVGVEIKSLRDMIKALRTSVERVKGSIVGIKTGLAYNRTLLYENVDFKEAEMIFNKLIARESSHLSFEEVKPLQDFMMHYLATIAGELGLPIQIHTGLQEGVWNDLRNSNPLLLIELLREHKNTKFDIFHAGYPFSRELGALAKQFPNVYLDLCWLHAISPDAARRILSEWLDLLPVNKILAFGGDYVFVEGAYGHAKIARENVIKVLTEKIDSGDMTLDEAKYVARRILRENALELFPIRK
ncbi:MAG: amidohydrolase [Thermoprotei archaeon]|nr:MAG: amidohydrolase [Thermoprotei archaeon]RLF19023.1 MAG: amidohydrolase [Thermoprotei archaeon]